MRVVVTLLVLLLAAPVSAQPIRFELQPQVNVGQRPQIRITATQAVTDVRVDLARDDGKRFALRHRALARGAAVTLQIGDGAAGKASYTGTLSASVTGQAARWSDPIAFETVVRAPLKIRYDADHLDLDRCVLQFQASRPPVSASLVAIGEDGAQLGTGAATYADAAADTWLTIKWKQPKAVRVMMLKLRVEADDGTATNVELIPWSVTIDHEDVTFATDSAAIAPAEHAKLDASLVEIRAIQERTARFMKLRLYVAGHTDTVGATAKNRKLSLARAQAIASYFRRQGLKLPIVYEGFGEDVLKTTTADGVDEATNRRVDYVLGPDGGAPPFQGRYRKVRAAWKPLR